MVHHRCAVIYLQLMNSAKDLLSINETEVTSGMTEVFRTMDSSKLTSL